MKVILIECIGLTDRVMTMVPKQSRDRPYGHLTHLVTSVTGWGRAPQHPRGFRNLVCSVAVKTAHI